MSLSALHSRSSRTESFRVLGVRLLPLMVGHLRHLEAEECDPVRTPGELATAVMICCRPPVEWERFKRGRFTFAKLALWGRLLGEWDFMSKLDLWCDYIKWHTEQPVVTMRGESRQVPVPTYRLLRVKLLRLGYPPSEIDTTPYLDALWDLTAAAALDGANVLDMTEDEMAEAPALTDEQIEEETRRLNAFLKGN